MSILVSQAIKENSFLAFVINLDSRPDRWYECQVQFRKLPFVPMRLPAIDSSSATIRGVDYVSNAVAACNYSHRESWQRFLNSSAEYLFVFEDDFVVTKKISLEVFNILISQDLDFLQVGYITSSFGEKISLGVENFRDSILKGILLLLKMSYRGKGLISQRLLLRERVGLQFNVVLNSAGAGTHAYIVNRKIASELLKMNTPMFLSADDFFIALAKMRIFRMARFRRTKVSQSQSKSSIRIKN
jgi:GR25 family glycosyltransferase involved in LPS biosynthesis